MCCGCSGCWSFLKAETFLRDDFVLGGSKGLGGGRGGGGADGSRDDGAAKDLVEWQGRGVHSAASGDNWLND